MKYSGLSGDFLYNTAKTTHCSVQLAFVLTNRSNVRALKMGSVECRGSSWILSCAAVAMPLGVTAEQLLLPGSQVCARTVRCDPSALCQAIGSCGGKPTPLNHWEWEPTGKCREKADSYTGQHQGSVSGGLMWAVCSWYLCSPICIVSRCYLTHLLPISSELLIFHKHCANPPRNTIDLCHCY